MMGRLEDIRYTTEQFKQLTALISEAQMDYSLVRMKLYKANAEERRGTPRNAEERLAKVRMSIVAQIVTEGRCTTRAGRNSYAGRCALHSSRPTLRS